MSGIRLRQLCGGAAIGALMLASAGVATSAASQPGHAASGGKTLTLGLGGDISWAPFKNQGTYQGWPYEAVYDYVVRCDAAGAIEPDIATSWKFTNHNKDFSFTLRSGGKFSDGTPVNAKTVAEALRDNQKSPGGSSFWANTTFTAVNATTLKIKSATPNPEIPHNLCSAAPLASPKYDGNPSKTNESYPVGSGPYTLDRKASTPGSSYTLVKNPSYWDAKDFPFAKIVFKIIASPTATIDALKTGQIDAAPINSTTYSEAKASGLKVFINKGETLRLLLTDHTGKVVPALGNLDVRRAMNMVFDKTAIASALYGGQATATDQDVGPTSGGYIKNYKDPYPYNVAAAKALMAKAGYANGFSINLPYLSGVEDSVIPVVVQQLGLIGIKVTQVPLTGPNAISELLGGTYPMILWPLGNYGASIDDIQQTMLTGGLWNVEHENDTTIDSLYKLTLAATGASYAADQKAMYKYVYNQAWFVPMDYVPTYYAYNPKDLSINSSSDYANLNPLLYDFKS